MTENNNQVLSKYNQLKSEVRRSVQSTAVADLIYEIFIESKSYLESKTMIQLVSRVVGKDYFAFQDGNKKTRAISNVLFTDLETVDVFWNKFNEGTLERTDSDLIQKALYTQAMSFCASIDLIKTRDQKTPGTFFEYFIAYFFSKIIDCEPERSIPILSMDDDQMRLPTDFIYNLGRNRQKFHMPIKTSSRERAIMLWAHQKLLDGVYGNGRFMGTPVLLAETKLNQRNLEVVEICLPDQWQLYQMYISKLKRVYYLDLPNGYQQLNNLFPPIAVKPFSDFFFEWESLIPI